MPTVKLNRNVVLIKDGNRIFIKAGEARRVSEEVLNLLKQKCGEYIVEIGEE